MSAFDLAFVAAVLLALAWALACEHFANRATLVAWVYDERMLTLAERVWVGVVLWRDGVQRVPRPARQVRVRP